MSKVDDDNKSMEQGLESLLGKTPYDPPTRVSNVCKHITDGFVEDETSLHYVFKCLLCDEYYKILKTDLE